MDTLLSEAKNCKTVLEEEIRGMVERYEQLFDVKVQGIEYTRVTAGNRQVVKRIIEVTVEL
jgi:hypothetical protein